MLTACAFALNRATISRAVTTAAAHTVCASVIQAGPGKIAWTLMSVPASHATTVGLVFIPVMSRRAMFLHWVPRGLGNSFARALQGSAAIAASALTVASTVHASLTLECVSVWPDTQG